MIALHRLENANIPSIQVDMASIAERICLSKLPVPIKANQVKIRGESILTVHPDANSKSTLFFAIQHLKKALLGVVVKGILCVVKSFHYRVKFIRKMIRVSLLHFLFHSIILSFSNLKHVLN